MKITLNKINWISFFAFILMASKGFSSEPVARYELEKLPSWSDTFNEFKKADFISLKIDQLMNDFQLDRMEAITVQRRYRDLLEVNPQANRQELFEEALQGVHEGHFGRTQRSRILQARFIVVFDLDETLYDQYLKSDNDCFNVRFSFRGSDKKILTIKKMKALVQKINQLGGEVALFSANVTAVTEENLKAWKNEDGLPVYSMSEIVAILTNRELVQQPRETGNTITGASKDLRFFDEKLQKVILVDDNPNRIFQQRNHRLVKKLDGDQYCSHPEVQKYYDGIMPAVLSEIEESVQYMNQNNVSFVAAYLPYSALGKIAVELLVSTENLTHEKAIDKIRKQPDLVDFQF